MRRVLPGVVLILCGLFQASPGMAAMDLERSWLLPGVTGRGAEWAAASLLLLSMGGLVAGGFGLLGAGLFAHRWRTLVWVGVGTSVTNVVAFLIGHSGALFAPMALALDGTAAAIALLWRAPHVGAKTGPGMSPSRSRWNRVSSFAVSVFLVYLAAVTLLRPWHRRWGATETEVHAPLPGDDLLPGPTMRFTRGITIRAPTDSIWPWVVQMGSDRAGFYSYDRLERLFGLGIHNTDQVVPAWQTVAPGDLVRAAPPDWLGGMLGPSLGFRVVEVQPKRELMLSFTSFGVSSGWHFIVEPLDSAHGRLIVRSMVAVSPSLHLFAAAPVALLGIEPVTTIMEMQMMRGLKARAERARRGR